MDDTFDLTASIKAASMRPIDVAQRMSVHKSQVCRWAKGRVPAERCAELSGLIGVPPHVLRPDIFPTPPMETDNG